MSHRLAADATLLPRLSSVGPGRIAIAIENVLLRPPQIRIGFVYRFLLMVTLDCCPAFRFLISTCLSRSLTGAY